MKPKASGTLPWPPHFAKAEGEPKRVQPSKAKSAKPFSEQFGEGFGAQRFRKRAAAKQARSNRRQLIVSCYQIQLLTRRRNAVRGCRCPEEAPQSPNQTHTQVPAYHYRSIF